MKKIAVLLSLILLSSAFSQTPDRVEFRRMVAHWTHYADTDYLPFIREAKPEVVQVGFYGGHYWSLAHAPYGMKYPAHFPFATFQENGDFFKDLNQKLHKEGVKVIGHFNVEFLIGDPDSPQGPRGFFKFYRDHWDEALLGKKPLEDPVQFLQRQADGTPLVANSYKVGMAKNVPGMKEYNACLNNPSWRKVLKSWVKVGIDRGVDGYVSNYFYRHNCLCEHCQKDFRAYLSQRFDANQLKGMGIENVQTHVFPEIVGWHNPKETTPLRLEMLRFSQISIKNAYDDVFVKYGRSLKKDLILGQWNHLSFFSQINGDERCLLPKELWGKDEDYLWYSTGAAAASTDFEKGNFGEGTLQARYIRGAFDNKPFTLGKYENTRIRAAIAELAANGGAPMGFYSNFKDPAAREVLVKYYQFLAKHDDLYRGSRPKNEVLLLFPRSHVHQGKVEPVEAFRQIGKDLLDRHVLFDIVPDDLVDSTLAKKYQRVISVTEKQEALPSPLSQFQAPVEVRISSDLQERKDLWSIHFVNYARENGAPSRGKGNADERPLKVEKIVANVLVPHDWKIRKVTALSPENEPASVEFRQEGNRLHFTMPEFLAYSVAKIELSKDVPK